MSDKEVCGCCKKTTNRSEEERKKLIHRLNRIEGQIRGIRGMVEKDAYCADILIQSAAVNAAVNAFNKNRDFSRENTRYKGIRRVIKSCMCYNDV